MNLPPNVRQVPVIRDHETLRMIGRGAYGEVWLARSVTGALRAVKVVRREDYDYPEAFEREFEAIKRYEPISRRHPGLVPILQVGRSDEEGFYYYIMELADDVEKGRNIDPETYRPQTMAARMHKAGRLGAEECIQYGATVAEALFFLHENGLIHRDVKPSNLIFTEGVCRLADIGLVALLGQRSFVGTEGFVAPEGPGTAQSDIFSLGMVLYEASTGKDRLDFPDLPGASDSKENVDVRQRLNRVICRACAHPAAERYANAQDLAKALRGERVPESRRWRRRAVAGALVGLVLGAVGTVIWRQGGEIKAALHRSVPMLSFRTEPSGAEVYSNGQRLGTTPLTLDPAEGVPAIYQIRLTGYRQQEVEHTAQKSAPATFELKLEPSRLPQPGERWVNSLGMAFVPRQSGHASLRPVDIRAFDRFIKATGRPLEARVIPHATKGEKDVVYIVVVPPADAEAFRYWLTDEDRSKGFLTNEHHYELETFQPSEPPPPASEQAPTEQRAEGRDWRAFSLRVERQLYGSVMLRSSPPGVRVLQREEFLGLTPLELPRVKTGDVEYELHCEGYSDLILEGEVVENEMLELYADMDARRGVTFGREWKNSLGMKLLPLGDLLMGTSEIRRRDYMEFVKATGAHKPIFVPVEQGKGAAVPVVGVNREEARAFCAWLTKREHDLDLIGKDDRYRLPTDEEWSRAVGLPPERGGDPAERNGRISGVYPWGYEWPPPNGVDNFADESAGKQQGLSPVIRGYRDRASTLANVTVFQPGQKGFIGLAGNASEWVDTDFNAANDPKKPVLGTVRGGNWRSANPEELLSSARLGVPPETRRDTIGFRVVLTHKPSPAPPVTAPVVPAPEPAKPAPAENPATVKTATTRTSTSRGNR